MAGRSFITKGLKNVNAGACLLMTCCLFINAAALFILTDGCFINAGGLFICHGGSK